MGALEGFDATMSNAMSTMGQGTPRDGSQFDQSGRLREMQGSVNSAKPDGQWTGAAADEYSAANSKQAGVLGGIADLDPRLRAEVDRSAAVVTAGRRDLEAVKKWVQDAASTVPNNKSREQSMYPIVSKGSKEISEILQRSNGDLDAIAVRIRGLGDEYQKLGDGAKPVGDKPADRGPDFAFGDKTGPWQLPGDPPPPSDSAPGGGEWQVGQPYPPGPGGGPPVGPFPTPAPWQKNIEPPVVGGTTALQDVVTPPPNGWGATPSAVLQEAYRIRVVGEGFNGAADHVRWVERNGNWYQAQWVDYNLEAEHVYQPKAKLSIPVGLNIWEPIDIKDIYSRQVDNPRLTFYLPTPAGGQIVLDPKRPGLSAG